MIKKDFVLPEVTLFQLVTLINANTRYQRISPGSEERAKYIDKFDDLFRSLVGREWVDAWLDEYDSRYPKDDTTG